MHRDRSWLRPLAGAAILGVLVWRVGVTGVVDSLRHVDGLSVVAAVAIAGLTTLCGAWRWTLVSRGLGIGVPLRSAVAESYRSQFLNVTLPGGVLGDVHRGVRHGRDAGSVGAGLRSVVWERSAGQVVLGGVTMGAVLFSAPLQWSRLPDGRSRMVGGVLVVLVAVLVVALLASMRRSRAAGGVARLVVAVRADVRAGLLGRHTWPGVVATSLAVVAGHVATFFLAARSAGVTAPLRNLLPLALIVLMAMALPLNVAGWGPREGAAAWVFAGAGLGASAGVATAVVYGVMAFAASLPGAALLVASRRNRRNRRNRQDAAPAAKAAPAPVTEGVRRG